MGERKTTARGKVLESITALASSKVDVGATHQRKVLPIDNIKASGLRRPS